MKWDKWQEEVLKHEGSMTLRCGRQTGKSEVISEKAVRLATQIPNITIMIVAAAQRQSSLLFEKVRAKIDLLENDESWYADKPTMTKIVLKNGSKIYTFPAGRTGYFIRGFTIDVFIADEAAYIPEMVWTAITPMIAVSRKQRGMGWIILLSTPFGKGGYFYESFHDPEFRAFHVSSENCPRIPRSFLAKEKRRMSKAEYGQEYLAEFRDEFNQLFPSELIKKCMTFIDWNKKEHSIPSAKYYLGVDISRYGGDQNAFVIAEMHKKRVKIVKCFTTERVSTTDTIGRIQTVDKEWRFARIFVDDMGIGGAVLDALQDSLGTRRVVGLNNSSKRVDVLGEEKKRGILKEDMYSNALMLMEQGRLEILADNDLARSLKSITFEYGDMSKGSKAVKIFGNYSHLAEAMVRACWCIKEQGLRIWFA